MRDIRLLFAYQKFKPNPDLQSRIDVVTEKYMSDGVEFLWGGASRSCEARSSPSHSPYLGTLFCRVR